MSADLCSCNVEGSFGVFGTNYTLFYMRTLLAVLVSLFISKAFAQHPSETLFDHYELKTASLGKVSIHVTKALGSKKEKPLLLYLDGSGNMPVFLQEEAEPVFYFCTARHQALCRRLSRRVD